MRLLKRIFFVFQARKAARRAGYGAEVLFAGWVELPRAFRELRRPGGPGKPTFT